MLTFVTYVIAICPPLTLYTQAGPSPSLRLINIYMHSEKVCQIWIESAMIYRPSTLNLINYLTRFVKNWGLIHLWTETSQIYDQILVQCRADETVLGCMSTVFRFGLYVDILSYYLRKDTNCIYFYSNKTGALLVFMPYRLKPSFPRKMWDKFEYYGLTGDHRRFLTTFLAKCEISYTNV